jgi:hypothetical protein
VDKRKIMLKRAVLPLLGLLIITACASGGGPSAPRTRQDILEAQEISTITVSNMYEAVQRLRPQWLQVRAQQSFNGTTAIAVFQGRTYLGGPEALKEVGPEAATRLRYLDGVTASATLPGLGSMHVEAAIVIDRK